MSKFDLKYLEKLAKLMTDSELTEVQLEDQEQSIILKREKQQAVVAQSVAPVVQAHVTTNDTTGVAQATEIKAEAPKAGRPIKSPMVGTFYKAASPDAPAFVEVGSLVAQGEVVCIIEAMKLMNEIESDFSGKIVEICVEDGQPVEYGQVLMYVE